MEQSIEKWLPVVGWEDLYEVSDHGRVRRRGRVLRPYPIGRWGHLSVGLWRHNVRTPRQVHHLVLDAFVGPRPVGMEALHGDGDAANNSRVNLRWGTHSENERDRVAHGTHNNASKLACPRGHELTNLNLVPSLLKRGKRKCLACDRAHSEAYRKHVPLTQEMADKHYSMLG